MRDQQHNGLSSTEYFNWSTPTEKAFLQNEVARLKELYRYQVLDTPTDSKLDELTLLAAEICQAPIALISFVDCDRQWFKSNIGLTLSQTPRHIAFCDQTIQQSDVFVVPNTLEDERFSNNPLVTEHPQIRFYAGVPLITPAGFALGTLCVLDYVPRQLSQQQLRALKTLSHQVMTQLELGRGTVEFRQVTTKLHQLQQQFVERESLSQHESILLNLANQIRHSLDLDTILQTSVNEIRNLLQVDRCLFLWSLPSGGQSHLTVTHEAKLAELPSLIDKLPDEYSLLLTHTIANLKILQIDDVRVAPHLASTTQTLLSDLGIRSVLVLPLRTYSGQFGAIVCSQRDNARVWTESEVKLLRAVTDQLAIALDQAELFAQTRSTALAAQTQAQYLTDALQRLQQTQAQLVQHEKMSSLGQLVAGVAHEINNPVNFISGNINYASDYIRDILELLKLYQHYYPEPCPEIQDKADAIDLEFITDDLPKLLSSMKVGVERIYQIVRSLRNFSRLDEADMKPVNIHEGIDSTLLILRNRLKTNSLGQSLQVIKQYGELPLVECYAGQLNQVFMNILSNAIDALDEVTDAPTITISTELMSCAVTESLDQDLMCRVPVPHAVIRIRDNGMGMLEEVQQKLFNPFFTTKPVGKGTGLGLSISYQIVVEKHKGLLKCTSQVGQGTEFWIQIPVEPLPASVEQGL
ncbi:GAF domain-containing protein [Oscillatoria sp. FACHB-1407]|uniref:GAF domain-containing protein n=1 Tax=Oscillatoria sp. FACHB-1407 TaxID=2692847 RepID=UPI001686BE25|nr:GAF domain-containing protein [Oscillatoria sp. FACHB-1407]MBD2459515.1 GAF domain-containing protein [Oscillatoria sp. FACHB-1407]